MLEIIKNFTNLAKQKNIRYCHWKSNIDLTKALNGDTDLDILVEKKDLPKLLEVFQKLDIREIRSWYHQQYPGVRDFLGYDEKSQKFVHFHVYIKIITGKSSLKELYLPLEKYLLNNIQFKNGFPIVIPEVEIIIFLIRLASKTTKLEKLKNFVKKFIKRKIDNSYYLEFKYLITNIRFGKFISILTKLPLRKDTKKYIMIIVENREYPDMKIISKLYSSLSHYRRFSIMEQYLILLLKKTFLKYLNLKGIQKKEMMSGGNEFVIVGMDGAGKTTIAKELHKKLSYKIRTKLIYLGSSDSSIVKNMFFMFALPLLALSKIIGSNKLRFYGWFIVEIGYFFHRRRKFKAGKYAFKRGTIVIYERYPIDNVSDFPFLAYYNEDVSFTFFQQKLIQWLIKKYKNTFILPKNIFVLNISLEDAMQRKQDHDIKLLREKYIRFTNFINKSTSNNTVVINTSAKNINDVTKELLNYIWKSI